MIWAVCCLAFFGFLRFSEFTVLGENEFDKSCHLSLNGVTIDNRDKPTQLKITIKQFETDSFHRGIDIYNRGLCMSSQRNFTISGTERQSPWPLIYF